TRLAAPGEQQIGIKVMASGHDRNGSSGLKGFRDDPLFLVLAPRPPTAPHDLSVHPCRSNWLRSRRHYRSCPSSASWTRSRAQLRSTTIQRACSSHQAAFTGRVPLSGKPDYFKSRETDSVSMTCRFFTDDFISLRS